MPGQSCMPVPADAAGAVIAEAEKTVRLAAAREEAHRRRRDRKRAQRQHGHEERARRAAEQLERRRSGEERLRAEADRARRVLLERAAGLREASGGSVPDCFAAVPDPRKRRGRRHCLPCVLTLVVTAMLHGKTKLADITTWIAHAGQDILAAAGARTGGNGRRQAPCGKTVTRLLGLVGRAGPRGRGGGLSRGGTAGAAGCLPGERAGPAAGPALRRQGSARCHPGRRHQLVPAVGRDRRDRARRAGDRRQDQRDPGIGPLLLDLNERVPLAGRVITADALCRRLICSSNKFSSIFPQVRAVAYASATMT